MHIGDGSTLRRERNERENNLIYSIGGVHNRTHIVIVMKYWELRVLGVGEAVSDSRGFRWEKKRDG